MDFLCLIASNIFFSYLFFVKNVLPASVIYYKWRVPEGERHDSAVKRNKEALTAEVKLWEGYLQKVYERLVHTQNSAAKVKPEALFFAMSLFVFHGVQY